MRDDRRIKDIYACKYIQTDEKIYPLQKWYNQLIDKKVSEIEVSDILRMIRQNAFIDIAVSRAIDYLKENPFVGDMYEGELLEKLSDINICYIKDYVHELKNILSKALISNANYGWIDDEERNEFAKVILCFFYKIECF